MTTGRSPGLAAGPQPHLHVRDSAAMVHALEDLRAGLLNYPVWSMLAWQEIRQRYRRSTLGPLWLTISTGVLIAGMGPLYGRLFGQDVSSYFPYLAVGFVVWQLISTILTEASQVFIGADQYIKQIRMPLSIHVLRMLWRNAIVFAHNLLIVVLVLLAYAPALGWSALLAVAGMLLILVNGIWVGTVLGLICARFRDIPPIVASLVQVAFFLTPVLWRKESLGKYQWAADLNPIFHLIEVVRSPLLGGAVTLGSWLAVLAMTVAGFAITLPIFARYRARIAYWI